MGLFDKLKNIMNTSSEASDPLQDETVKKYYDIIYDMRTSRGWFGVEKADVNSRAKKYVELILGEACNEEHFVKAVELINLSRNDHPINKFEIQLVNYRNSLYEEYKARDYKSTYDFDLKTICATCYAELLAEIKSNYESMLNVIEDDESCECLEDGLKKYIFDKHRDTQDSSVVKDCLCIAITDSFVEGNEATKEIVFELLENEEDENLSENIDLEHITTVISDFIER